jgi:hypothetical protein
MDVASRRARVGKRYRKRNSQTRAQNNDKIRGRDSWCLDGRQENYGTDLPEGGYSEVLNRGEICGQGSGRRY